MSKELESSCCENCEKVYGDCKGSGNPLQEEKCEKFRKRCREQCGGC